MQSLVLFVILAAGLAAQQQPSGHAATLTWEDARNPAGTTYSVYRATGLCSGTPSWSKVASALSVKTYEDTTVDAGNYCYMVTATFSGVESAPSNLAHAPVPSFNPQQLQVTVR